MIQRLAGDGAAAARDQHLRPLAQGDLRRSVRLPAGRAGGRLGHGDVPRPSRRQGDDLPPRRAAPDRLSARADPGRDAPAHGLRRRGAPAGRGLARLYDPQRGHRMPPQLLRACRRAIPAVVDEIAFQPRRNLAERALAGVIRFTAARPGGDPARGRAARPRPLAGRAAAALHWSAPAATRSRRAPTSRPCRG